mgnify:CR=1 FL=1
MNKKFYIELIFLILLGCLTSLSLPPFYFVIINFFTLSLFFIFLIKKSKNNKNKKIFFLYGWFFGFGYFVSNLYWISISLTFDKNFTFLIPIVIIIVPGFLAIFYGLTAYLFVLLKSNKILSSFFLFSLIFGLMEFLRGYILTGFPWNLIAYSFSNHLEILNITSIIGTYGFNLFCISLFISPSIFILRNKKQDISLCIAFIITTISFFFIGSQNIEKLNKSKVNKYDYRIRLVASNISIDRFLYDIDPVSTIEELIEISSPNKDERTIFVWPEGILPGISQKQLPEYERLFKDKFSENHLLAIGINSTLNENHKIKYFNSFSIYDHELKLINSYNKINLVPFGEFLPLENIMKKIGFKTITNSYQSYSKGNQRNIIDIDEKNFSLKILPLICYEIIYSGKIFKNSNFDFIINISEDGWFGQTGGPKQHFVHSIFRAVESGKYVLRSSNNGITAIINPAGVVEKQIDLNQSGYIDFNQSRAIEPTLFSKYGNKIFGLIILLYIFLVFSFNRNKNE